LLEHILYLRIGQKAGYFLIPFALALNQGTEGTFAE
jgi:hypothetical protein